MEKLKNTRLWTALHTLTDAVNRPKTDGLLDAFVQELYTFCRNEKVIAERTRSLNYVKSNLDAHLEHLRHEVKKKCAFPKGRRFREESSFSHRGK
jgi:hypothetical protein